MTGLSSIPDTNADGSLDTSFGTNGYTSPGPYAVLPDGRIISAYLVIGGNIYVNRSTADGQIDITFGNGGTRIVDFGVNELSSAVTVLDDGRILVGASVNVTTPDQRLGMARLMPDGSFDTSFGRGGRYVEATTGGIAYVRRLLPDESGGVFAAGRTEDLGPTNEDFIAQRYVMDAPMTVSGGGPYGPVDEGSAYTVTGSVAGATATKYEWAVAPSQLWSFTTTATGPALEQSWRQRTRDRLRYAQSNIAQS